MDKELKWVDIFGNAPSMTEWKPEQYAKNITLIYPVIVPFDGWGLKLKFSNKYGTEAVTVSSYSVMENEKVLFKSDDSFVMHSGEEHITEEHSICLNANSKITIRFYLSDYTNMSSGVLTTGFLSGGECAEGDYTEIAVPDRNRTVSTKWNYFLTDIFMLTSSDNHSVICFGDSITAQDWPDYLYKLLMDGKNNHTAVVRKAVSGTRLLRQYECNKYRSYGIKGDIRFPHESEVEGADTIIIQHGINDIIHPVGEDVNEFRPMSDLPTSREMIEALKMYIETARSKKLKVYLGTLLPIEGWRTYAPFREELRCEVNEWIRTTDLADGVIDFDLAVRDPDNEKAFARGFDSGDHLHPSVFAYATMGRIAYEAIKE